MTKAAIYRWECKSCNAQETGVHLPVACSTCGSAPGGFRLVSEEAVDPSKLSLPELQKLSADGLATVEAP